MQKEYRQRREPGEVGCQQSMQGMAAAVNGGPRECNRKRLSSYRKPTGHLTVAPPIKPASSRVGLVKAWLDRHQCIERSIKGGQSLLAAHGACEAGGRKG